jgi:predicted phage-related endonuclease
VSTTRRLVDPIKTYPDEAAWLDARRHLITASEMAEALGMSEYGGSPAKLARRKLGIANPTPRNERMTWGLRLETAILEGHALDLGVRVCFPPRYTIYQHPRYPWIGATLDALLLDPENECPFAVADAKVVGHKQAAKWADGDAPVGYTVQALAQLFILRELIPTVCEARLVPLIDGTVSPHVRVIEWNPTWEETFASTRSLWETIERGEVPPERKEP